MRTKVLLTVSPHSAEDPRPVYEVWTREAAIRISRSASVQARGFDVYYDDEEALEDFITTHWAHWIDLHN